MLGLVANALLLSRNSSATIYESLFMTAPKPSKVFPKSLDDRNKWLQKTKKPKISAFEHLRIGNLLISALLYCFKSKKQTRMNKLIS